jgi:predicted AlkP superfamily pyrophosphatase or phosphodiesterase
VPSEPVRPDYDGAWVGAVVPALLGGDSDGGWLPDGLRDARGICLLVIDGLGWHTLDEFADQLPTLRSLEGGPIITAAPPTTSAVLTSISTGLPPARHGVVGYRMRVGGEVLNVLRWETRSGQRPQPEEVQPAAAFESHNNKRPTPRKVSCRIGW